MYRALLVDDCPRNREYLRTLLEQYGNGVAVMSEAGHIEAAEAALGKDSPDIVFLDVEMPGGSGFDLLRKMGTWSFDVVFTTAFDHYAIQAIRFSALDYLLKPVQPDELVSALQRFKERRGNTSMQEAVQERFISNLAQADEQGLKLTLTRGDRCYSVGPAEISHCVADGNYTELYKADGSRFISARTLKDYEEMLRPWGFVRVHRSALVNRAKVARMTNGHVTLESGLDIEVSRRRWEEARKELSV